MADDNKPIPTPEQLADIYAAAGLTPEQIAFVEATKKAYAHLCECWGIAAGWVNEWAAGAAELLKKAFQCSDLTDAELFAACDNPKHWHLYKNAKKLRTRKKYRRKLERRLNEKRGINT